MSYWGGGFFHRYVTVEERKKKAKKQIAALLKKGIALDPVTIEGKIIAKSWWGAHWNQNLERYADYAYRLDRGRSYVRSGAVLDLKIKEGVIEALVAGSGRKPYEVKITIKRLDPGKWKTLVEQTSGRIETVSGLLEGVFPHELVDLFFAENKGLFPAPEEIRFNCSCPDDASLCKHTAAALYGTGARLDKQPALFFTLRKVDMQELVGKAAAHAAGRLLSKADAARGKRGRILDLGETHGDLSRMFGIAMDKNVPGSKRTPSLKQTIGQVAKHPRRSQKHRKKRRTVSKGFSRPSCALQEMTPHVPILSGQGHGKS